MVKMNVEFQTPEQLVEFSSMCQRTEADTLIEDVAHKLIRKEDDIGYRGRK